MDARRASVEGVSLTWERGVGEEGWGVSIILGRDAKPNVRKVSQLRFD